jgi:hypothetical protein
MRTLLIASPSMAIAALCAAATTAMAQSPGTDSVTGSASDCVKFYEPVPGVINCARLLGLNVEVASGPAGEHPTGTVALFSGGVTPGGSFSAIADASCLSVSGPVAIIGLSGNLHQGGFGTDFGMAGLVRVVDGGGPNSGADSVEFAYRTGDEPLGPPLPGPTTCSTFPATFFTDTFHFPDFTNAEGDVVVTDTVPLPTAKDQCKNGGWRNFPGFKNQGDCVSFVATKGTNPPAGG